MRFRRVSLIDSSTGAEGAIDLYEAADLPKPSLSELSSSYIEKAEETETPQLAIEALRGMLVEQASVATLHNIVRQRAFSERITDLMVRYTNQQITAAQMFAALGDVSRDISEEARRGEKFDPPLEHYEFMQNAEYGDVKVGNRRGASAGSADFLCPRVRRPAGGESDREMPGAGDIGRG